ncbi:unnamed protein product [Eruca vesicaria subsp. sativa]|uniref:Uncharacterized protein n=1 Tax=Eruca vesicaria subsp. sativa TaxID=29727 RepID=A0ABC8LW57_ERUVS|nr:unnamed protein product [Eruca vesicaria subsp. sativa]
MSNIEKRCLTNEKGTQHFKQHDATNYEFNEETCKLTVFIRETCEVGFRDSSVLRFSTTVTGYLEKGKLAEVEGLKDASKVYFTAEMKKSRSRDVYEVKRPSNVGNVGYLREFCRDISLLAREEI